jgi:hypothetical protein
VFGTIEPLGGDTMLAIETGGREPMLGHVTEERI